MTKSDFKLIAQAFSRTMLDADARGHYAQAEGIADAAIVLASMLEEKFPRFAKAKFLVACGLPDNCQAVMRALS